MGIRRFRRRETELVPDMAVKTACTICKKSFSAPDQYRGKKVDCPVCGKRTVVESAADRREAERVVEKDRQRKAADYEKLALLERLEERRGRPVGRPYHETFDAGAGGVRQYKPGAPSRFLGLRALSDLLLIGAYLEVFLVVVGVAITGYLWFEAIVSTPWAVLALVVWTGAGVAAFLLLKSFAELALLLADVGDQQTDLVKLLLDIRSNTDPDESSL